MHTKSSSNSNITILEKIDEEEVIEEPLKKPVKSIIGRGGIAGR
jgi:hypothetical protein